MKTRDAWWDSDHAFCDERGAPLSPIALTNAFRRCAINAGLPTTRLRDLRHTAATFILSAGGNPAAAAQILGHAEKTTTLRLYGHVIGLDEVRAAKFLPLFRDNINYVSHLVCAGYGFGDDHINTIIREWLELTKQRRLEIVSHCATVPNTLKHLAPQVSVVTQKWMDHLEPLSPKPFAFEERALKTGLEALHKKFSEPFSFGHKNAF